MYLISSLAFASSHENYISIANALVFGIILMLIYKKYCSIFLVILLHTINNACAVIFTNYISMPFIALEVLSDYANNEQMWCAVIISVAVFMSMVTIVILCIGWIIKQNNNVIENYGMPIINSIRDKIIDGIIIGILGILSIGMIVLKVCLLND
jgi:hypothetical protein